ncbi:MAG: type II secretion system GspH family protein [Candidatus Margulisbacteria bacterium]|nr:type II secretion system GspH family protein [Candidatus Margulisiibacteriota bacterium]
MNKRGFTLIELIVATSLFLIAVASFSQLLKIAASSITAAERLNLATYEIQAEMEELRSLTFNQLYAQSGRSFAQGKGKIQVSPVLADLVRVELVLNWHPQKVPFNLSALRSKY